MESGQEKIPKKIEDCKRCQDEFRDSSHRNIIDLLIWHENNHVWPGFAGEPDSGDYGGSDF